MLRSEEERKRFDLSFNTYRRFCNPYYVYPMPFFNRILRDLHSYQSFIHTCQFLTDALGVTIGCSTCLLSVSGRLGAFLPPLQQMYTQFLAERPFFSIVYTALVYLLGGIKA